MGIEFLLHRFLKPGVDIKTAMDVVKHIGAQGALGMGGEGATEAVQEVIGVLNNEWDAKTDVPLLDRMTSKENMWRYAEAGVAGAIFGGIFGGAGGAVSGMANKQGKVTGPPGPSESTPLGSPPAEAGTGPVQPGAPGTGAPPLGEAAPPVEPIIPAGPSGVTEAPEASLTEPPVAPSSAESVSEPGPAEIPPTVEAPAPPLPPPGRKSPSEASQVLKTGEPVVIKPTESVAPTVVEATPAPAPAAMVDPPAAKVEPPAPVAKVEPPAPVAKVEPPAAKVEPPAAKVEPPAAKVEAPAAKVEAPAAKVEAPAPAAKVELPAAKVELPAAKVEAPKTEAHSVVSEPPLSIKANNRDDPRLDGLVFTSETEAKPLRDALWALGVQTGIEDETQTPFALHSVASTTKGTEFSQRQSGILGYAHLHATQKALDAVNGDTKALKTALDAEPHVTGMTYDSAYAAALKAGHKAGSFVVGMRGGKFAYAPLKVEAGKAPSAKTAPVAPVAKAPVAPAVKPKSMAEEIRTSTRAISQAIKDKDARKAELMTQFIGESSTDSSTADYVRWAGGKANTGKYSASDKVFVSVNGKRAGRTPLLVDGKLNGAYKNLQKAVDAKATILADNPGNRANNFNKQGGEADLATWLTAQGYVETPGKGVEPSTWTPAKAEAPTPAAKTPHLRVTPERIDQLGANQVFVFGSNEAGIHGKGAALTAKQKFGAQQGRGIGAQGRSYALPTKSTPYATLSLEAIRKHVEDFIAYAKQHPSENFLVTRVGLGNAGLKISDIAPLFAAAKDIENVALPQEVRDFVPVKAEAPKQPSLGPVEPSALVAEQAKITIIGLMPVPKAYAETITKILKKVLTYPSQKGLQAVKYYGFTAKGSEWGQWFPNGSILTFGKKFLDRVSNGSVSIDVAAHTVYHEVGHAVDSLGVATYSSPTSPAWAVDPSKIAVVNGEFVFQPGWGGPLIEQMYRLHQQAYYAKEANPLRAVHYLHTYGFHQLEALVVDPKNADLRANTIKEVFAQAHAIYALNGADLAKAAPDVHAFFEEIYEPAPNESAPGDTFDRRVLEAFRRPRADSRATPGQSGTNPGTGPQGEQARPGARPQAVERGVSPKETAASLPSPGGAFTALTQELRRKYGWDDRYGHYTTGEPTAAEYAELSKLWDEAGLGRAENQPADRNVQGPAPARPGELDPSTLTEADAEEGINAAIQAYWKSPTYLDNPTQYKINVLNKVLREKQGGLLNYVLNTYSPQANKARALTEAAAKKRQEGTPKTPFDSKRQSPTPGQTPKQFRQAIQHKLLDRANVHVLHRTTDAPFTVAPDTAGLYLPDGSSWFFTENIAPGEEWGKVFHEVGAHYGLARLVGRDAYARILKDLKGMVTGEGFASVKEAHRRAVAAGATGAAVWHETLGYLAEISPRHGLVRRLIAAARQFLRSIGLVGKYTDADLIGLIQTAALKEGLEGRVGLSKGQLASKTDPLSVQPIITAHKGKPPTTLYGIFGYGTLIEGGFTTEQEAQDALKKDRAEYAGYAQENAPWSSPHFKNIADDLDAYFGTRKREQKDPPDVVRSEERPFANPKQKTTKFTESRDYPLPDTSYGEKIKQPPQRPVDPAKVSAARGQENAPSPRPMIEALRRAGQLHAESPEGALPKAPLVSHLRPTPLARLDSPALAALAKSLRAIKDPVDAAAHALSLMSAPEADGVAQLLSQYGSIFARNLSPERTLGAIEYLYATTLQQSDQLRALTAFVSQEDLPLHEHLLRALDAFDGLRRSDSSTVADIEANMTATAEASTAFGAKAQDIVDGLKAQDRVSEGMGDMQVQSLYERERVRSNEGLQRGLEQQTVR